MLTIYMKQIRKTWSFWILPILLLVGMAFLLVSLWPEYEPLMQEMQEILEHPLYQAIIGEATFDIGITSFEGFLTMDLFILSDFVFIALTIQHGTTNIAGEANSGTLDLLLSYPVPRWRFLLKKLLAVITLTLTFPILVWGTITLSATALNIGFNSIALLFALFAKWILYITLTCIVFLCSVIFMDSSKTLGSAGVIIGGSYILERIGGLIRAASERTADTLQGISIFHYLDAGTVMNAIMDNEGFPLNELGILITIGTITLLTALVLFQKREFKR
ncbi:MAG: ABC transporter permease subunit [Candidatus Ranarchaeia archaeon]